MEIHTNILDISNRRIDAGRITVANGRITTIVREGPESEDLPYAIPGFVDAHVHIESSMLVPTEFARMAVRHGTVATVSDPHEIANVLGTDGVLYMLANAEQSPLKFFFGAPSCVPATAFETAGAVIDSHQIRTLLERNDILYLAEMMNFPGVLHGDPEVLAKIMHARQLGKPVDGHAPGLTGADAIAYINAGIQTDHECVTYDEARFKLEHGMKIIIREGSAAKNFEALAPLIGERPGSIMLCSDDKHPDDLVVGHINDLVRRAVQKGASVFDALQAACINPVEHYNLPVGQLSPGDAADLVLLDDITNFRVTTTMINGEVVFSDGKVSVPSVPINIVNRFSTSTKEPQDFQLDLQQTQIRVIRAIDGALITEELHASSKDLDQPERDILKIAVVNRYKDAPPAVAYIHGFGLEHGALASSVAHDSHNIVVVGTNDDDICAAVNEIIRVGGGVSAVHGSVNHCLPLPVAGLMSDQPGDIVAAGYTAIDRYVKDVLGSTLTSPFMTLSFMALLVIPQLKLSDLGLFDGKKFEFVELQISE